MIFPVLKKPLRHDSPMVRGCFSSNFFIIQFFNKEKKWTNPLLSIIYSFGLIKNSFNFSTSERFYKKHGRKLAFCRECQTINSQDISVFPCSFSQMTAICWSFGSQSSCKRTIRCSKQIRYSVKGCFFCSPISYF